MDFVNKPSPELPETRSSFDDPYSAQAQEDKTPTENRFVLLCDGIFAISITLLVIDIKLPDGLSEAQFNQALRTELFSAILFYAITFFVIAGYWRLHHQMLHIMKRLDNRFITLNFVFLAFIAFFPAASGFLGLSHLYTSIVIIYTLTIAGCGFSALAMWLYATWHRRLVDPFLTREDVVSFSIRIARASFYFCLTLLLLLIPVVREKQPFDVFWSWLLLPVFSFLVHQVSRGRVTRWLADLFPSL